MLSIAALRFAQDIDQTETRLLPDRISTLAWRGLHATARINRSRVTRILN
jgi:hypothetical protein